MLDANFIINLKEIECSYLLSHVSKKLGWTYYLTPKVKEESTVQSPLDLEIVSQIQEGIIVNISCNKMTFNFLKGIYGGLGDGELEAISIINDCIDKTFSQYLFFSNDNKAVARAEELGMKSQGILTFLKLCNDYNIISKQEVIKYVSKLKNFTIKPNDYNQFVSTLT